MDEVEGVRLVLLTTYFTDTEVFNRQFLRLMKDPFDGVIGNVC